MSVETKDYYKLGSTTYRAQFYGNNGHDSFGFHGKMREFWEDSLSIFHPLDQAKNWIAKELAVLNSDPHAEITWWARIEKGTYEDSSFDDPGYGHVYDASWEPDESFHWDSSEES